ncbi:MAG: PmoA family protein [Filimonas sp.]|nr:PmoA family protein [Filimonas sp.]
MKPLYFLLILLLATNTLLAQRKDRIQIDNNTQKKEITITANGKPFTTLLYSDTLYKPFLFPIYSPHGQVITRGYPLATRKGEPTDHPHHTGLWFNYENLNGLDFWNNSYAIAAAKKDKYGSIKTDSILSVSSGREGTILMISNWVNNSREVLLKELTTFAFTAYPDYYIIDRVALLTAVQDIAFTDTKDGLIGLRVAKELELPYHTTKPVRDPKALPDTSVHGSYINSEGKKDEDVWGVRARWCMLYGPKDGDEISIAILDHPENIGYPTYWHARSYGLFAANPFGQKVYSEGKEELNFKLQKGQQVTLRYRIIVASTKERLSNETIEKAARAFSRDR